MLSKVSASAVLCALFASAGAAETTIDWTIKPYTDMKAFVGDKVIFNYDSFMHDVVIHPTNDCTEDGAIEIGPRGRDIEASASHVFTEAEAGTTVTFACDVTQHCEAGQIVKFIVSDAPETPPVGENTEDALDDSVGVAAQANEAMIAAATFLAAATII